MSSGILVCQLRLSTSSLAKEVVESLKTPENYHIVYEEEIRDHAIKITLEIGSSGFNTYFIAVARYRYY